MSRDKEDRLGDGEVVMRGTIGKLCLCLPTEEPLEVGLDAWDNRETLSVFTDSDWAGNKTTRTSTSGGCVMLGSHLISHWSKVQSNVAFSSGKAQLNAAVKGLSELIGFIRVVP